MYCEECWRAFGLFNLPQKLTALYKDTLQNHNSLPKLNFALLSMWADLRNHQNKATLISFSFLRSCLVLHWLRLFCLCSFKLSFASSPWARSPFPSFLLIWAGQLYYPCSLLISLVYSLSSSPLSPLSASSSTFVAVSVLSVTLLPMIFFDLLTVQEVPLLFFPFGSNSVQVFVFSLPNSSSSTSSKGWSLTDNFLCSFSFCILFSEHSLIHT